MQLTAPIPSGVRRFVPPQGPAYLPWLMGTVGLLLVGGLGVFIWQRFIAPPPPAPTGQIVQIAKGTVSSSVSATGTVVSTKQARLAFNTTGKLKEIMVGVGTSVKAGQPLARIQDDALLVKVDQAESSLKTARIRMEQLTEGATPEDLAAAQATYDAAVAKLNDVAKGATAIDLRSAEASVASAQASYDQAVAKVSSLEQGADLLTAQASYESAKSTLANAQAKLDDLKLGAKPEDVAAAQGSVESAKNSLNSAQSRLEQLRATNNLTTDLAGAQSAYDAAVSGLKSAEAKLNQAKANTQFSTELVAAESAMLASKKTLDNKADEVKQAFAELEYRQHNIEILKEKARNDCDGGASTCNSSNSAVDAAYSPLYAAEAKYRDLQSGGSDIRIAQANYDAAKAKYDAALVTSKIPADLIAAQGSYDSAVASVSNAKLKLDQLNASRNTDLNSAQLAFDAAKLSLTSAELKLQTMQKGATITDTLAAQTAVDNAQANMNTAQAKMDAMPTDLQVARIQLQGAQANLSGAQAKLADLRGGPKPADLASAQSSVASAQSSLATKSGSAKASDLALQQENVRQAELAVRQAQIDLEGATLLAPFDGVISTLTGNVGETAPTNMITILDPREVRVDITVDESDVAKLALGNQALVTFDAVPNRPYVGRVIAVAPAGTTTQGVVTYPISLAIEQGRPDTLAPLLRATGGAGAGNIQVTTGGGNQGQQVQAAQAGGGNQGQGAAQRGQGQQGQGQQAQPQQPVVILPAGLTASTNIIVEQRDDVVRVPNRAIRRQGQNQTVEVSLGDGKSETRRVRTGLANDQFTEVIEGLNEGESVVIAPTTTRAPTTGGNAGFGGIGGGPVVVTKP
jgi:multidrug efflux pump subunit AcrA (membrane-fusion protein)